MIRTLLATTALAALLSTGTAFAQQATSDPAATTAPATTAPATAPRTDAFLATKIMGENVYNGTSDDAQKIGDVKDMVITRNGNVESVVVGVGGFLGMGQKNVALPLKDLQWAEKSGERWLVTAMTKEQLQAQPDFDTKAFEPAPATAAAPAATGTGDQAANNAMAPADNTAMAPAPAPDATATTAAIDKSQLTPMAPGDIRSDDLVGTTVYGANDAKVGKIGDVVLTQDGKVDAIIIDVGGFLGIGAKEVAIGMDKLSFMTDKDGNKYLYTNFTKDQLKAQPAYDKTTWAEQRTQQRMMVQ